MATATVTVSNTVFTITYVVTDDPGYVSYNISKVAASYPNGSWSTKYYFYVDLYNVTTELYQLNDVIEGTLPKNGNSRSWDVNRRWRFDKNHSQQTVKFEVNMYDPDGGSFDRIAYSSNINFAAKTTYTLTYAANGGSSTPGTQTKWHNETFSPLRGSISRSNASAGTYTVALKANGGSVSPTSLTAARTTTYSFSGWKCSANGTVYAANGTLPYTVNQNCTMTAQWASTTSTASVTLPTATSAVYRRNYTLAGWYTAATGGTKVNASSNSYKPTGSINLYAHWTQVYDSPQLTINKIYRCNDSGQMDDEGMNVAVACSFKIWKTSATNTCTLNATVQTGTANQPSATASSFTYSSPDGSTWRAVDNVTLFIPCTSSASSGTYNSPLSTDNSYAVTLTVTDTQGATTTTATDKSYRATSRTATVTSSFYLIDFLAGSRGRGITIGGAAVNEGFNVQLPMTLGSGTETDTAISYRGPNRTGAMIKFIPNTADGTGDGVVIGGGGTVVVGSGESADAFRAAAGVTAGQETTYITSDNSIYFVTNCNTIEDRKTSFLSSGGGLSYYQSSSRTSNNVANAATTPNANAVVSGFYDYDAAGVRCGYSEVVRSTTGLYRSFAVENPKVSKTTALYLYADDSGTQRATLSTGAAWAVGSGGTGATTAAAARTNLGANASGVWPVSTGGTGASDFFSATDTSGSSVNVSSGSRTQLATVSLATGYYLIIIGCYCGDASSGGREWIFTTAAASSASPGRLSSIRLPGGVVTYTTLITTVAPSSTTTYRVHGWQNSGSTLVMSAYIRVIKIR